MAGPADILWMGIGGGAGSVLRWAVARLVNERAAQMRRGGDFPWATFAINVSGSFLMGLLAAPVHDQWLNHRLPGAGVAILDGLPGGYTTFSTMELEACQRMRGGQSALASFYLILSLGVGLIAALAGGWCAARLH